MMNWYDRDDMMISCVLSEDVGAPELRSPEEGAMTAPGWLARLFGKVR